MPSKKTAATLSRQATGLTGSDDEPLMIHCPKCGVAQEDHDGFGVLYCEACGYCTHASVNGTTCGLCGQQVVGESPADDESWRDQTIPTFGDEPSRDEQIADLDARADQLNGHVPEDGVRPSERCGTRSPLGITCTHRDFHQGLHSWTPGPIHQAVESSDFGTTNEDGKSEQPTLPGTPEPEQNDYIVPFETAFGGKDLVAAPGLKAIAERLIASDDSLEHLLGAEVRYFWRRRGGTQGGNPRFGRIKRPGLYENYFSGGKVIFLADLSSDHVREARFSDQQIEACLYSLLCRTAVDPDDHDAYRINGPDFSGFVRELERFGDWSADLREMHAHVARLPLLEAIEDAAADQGDGEDEGADAD